MKKTKDVKFINDPYSINTNKDYIFIDVNNKEHKISIDLDKPDMELIKHLQSKSNVCYFLVTNGTKESYFIKFCAGFAFDPLLDSKTYRMKNWRWKSVTKKVFETYIKFLSTKKIQLLRVVERVS